MHMFASKGTGVLDTPKVKERWRAVLAVLVAALAVPFLVFNSPDSAEGVETGAGEIESLDDTPATEEVTESAGVEAPAVEFVVTQQEVAPDVPRLAAQASTWAVARAEAIADGLVVVGSAPPPSDTNLALLPTVDVSIPTTQPEAPENEPETAEETDTSVEETSSESSEATDGEAQDGEGDGTPGNDEAPGQDEEPAEETDEPADAEADADEEADVIDEESISSAIPATPPQVGGRVPPPPGGPTGEQWDALRFCESTHNYAAISPSGLYRGAYQFSQQTWDWVAGIHHPYLVGLDPADAPPGWQDVMAYTLFAMRGWDQWPICGTNLL